MGRDHNIRGSSADHNLSIGRIYGFYSSCFPFQYSFVSWLVDLDAPIEGNGGDRAVELSTSGSCGLEGSCLSSIGLKWVSPGRPVARGPHALTRNGGDSINTLCRLSHEHLAK